MMFQMIEDTKTTPTAFLDWLDGLLRETGFSDSEASQRAGLSHSAIYDIRSGVRPGIKKCEALARLFGYPLEHVLRLAGYLPPVSTDSGIDARAAYLIHQLRELLALLPPEQQERIMSTTILMADALAAAATATEQAEKARDPNRELSRK